jgi:hypothetical protein
MNNGRLGRIVIPLLRPFFLTPEAGAKTSIYLASSDEVDDVSGKYFAKCRPTSSSPDSYDEALARRLWEKSSQLTGLEPFDGPSRRPRRFLEDNGHAAHVTK